MSNNKDVFSPVSPDPLLCGFCADQDSHQDSLFAVLPDGDIEVDLKDARFDDPIVGVEHILSGGHGPGARRPRPLPSPRPMTPAEKLIHDLTHLPFHPGCPICRATRTPNVQHRASHEHLRVVSLLVADHCFLRTTGGAFQPVLVMTLYP